MFDLMQAWLYTISPLSEHSYIHVPVVPHALVHSVQYAAFLVWQLAHCWHFCSIPQNRNETS